MKNQTTRAFREYEAGRDYKRSLGIFESARRNERFYRGDQWYGEAADDCPTPVFNVIRRVVDYQVSSVLPQRADVRYTDEDMSGDAAKNPAFAATLEAMSRHAGDIWERSRMTGAVKTALLDAALCGDGVFYSYLDTSPRRRRGGEIITAAIDASCVYPADVTSPDVQSQEYIIVASRRRVSDIRREAREAGLDPSEIEKIVPDSDGEIQSESGGRATYLVKFSREDGRVVWECSTKFVTIRREATSLKLYPIAKFSWCPRKSSFHGASPVDSMVENQKFINRAYSLVMKHMEDTAFSKVVYDKAKIPEWSAEVGEAIGVVGGGGSVADSVAVLGNGKLSDGYLELIESTVRHTKEMAGATDAALGNVTPTNTSAIIALQEASDLSLGAVRASLAEAIEEVASIWADMMTEYYSDGRRLSYTEDGRTKFASADLSLLRDALISSRVDVTVTGSYSKSVEVSTLNTLLQGGFITFEQYIERIPDLVLPGRYALLQKDGR